ncbi:MAG: DUF4826 family protein [Proteobacteria bacterium]|nr:DUF4826 family protein [Pseudomonadota bacterium]
MAGSNHSDTDEAVTAWIRETLDKAVQEITSLGVIDDKLVEARPVWSVPYKVMIGQVRVANDQSTFRWIISGDLPTDHISSTVAATPREAVRYFSIKWQRDATRYNDPAARKAHGLDETLDWNQLTEKLVAKAEELYDMAGDDRLWRQTDNS